MEMLNNSIVKVNENLALLGQHLANLSDGLLNDSRTALKPLIDNATNTVNTSSSNLMVDDGLAPATPNPRDPNKVNSRTNLFVDDGSLHRDSDNVTPRVDLQPRIRQAANQLQADVTCQRCHRSSKVASVHARDYFVCDRCITGRK